MKVFNKDIGDSIILTSVTVTSYLCAVAYQAGKYSAYGIPAAFVDTSIKTIVQSWAMITAFLIVAAFELSIIALLLFQLWTWATTGIIKLTAKFGPMQALRQNIVSLWTKIQKARVIKLTQDVIKQTPWLFGPLFTVYALVIAAFMMGQLVATLRTSYTVEKSAPNCPIVAMQDSKYVCVEYDWKKSQFTNNYHIREIKGDSNFKNIHTVLTPKFPTANPFTYIWNALKFLS